MRHKKNRKFHPYTMKCHKKNQLMKLNSPKVAKVKIKALLRCTFLTFIINNIE